jgi:hypothetical protein
MILPRGVVTGVSGGREDAYLTEHRAEDEEHARSQVDDAARGEDDSGASA